MKHEKLKKLVALTLVIGLTLTEMPMLAKAATNKFNNNYKSSKTCESNGDISIKA